MNYMPTFLRAFLRNFLDRYVLDELDIRLEEIQKSLTKAGRLISHCELEARTSYDKAKAANLNLEQLYKEYIAVPSYYQAMVESERLLSGARYAGGIVFLCGCRLLKTAPSEKAQALIDALTRCEDLIKISYMCRVWKTRKNAILLGRIDAMMRTLDASELPDDTPSLDNQLVRDQVLSLKFFRQRSMQAKYYIDEADALQFRPIQSGESASVEDWLSILKQDRHGETDLIVQNKLRSLMSAYLMLILRIYPTDTMSVQLLAGINGRAIAAEFSQMRQLALLCLEKSEAAFLEGARQAQHRAELLGAVSSKLPDWSADFQKQTALLGSTLP
ncbi:hypothetical protein BH10CYA1_BH10CYA1_48480 [soil metagenome]